MQLGREWLYFAVALLSFGFCYLLIPLCSFISRLTGLIDHPGGDSHKSHERSTPLLGGVAIYGSVWLTLLFLVYMGELHWSPALNGIFIGSTLVFLMGLADDIFGLLPATKFFVQLGAAVVVVLHGVTVSLFMGTNIITVAITILWIVGLTNSLNLLDNMDGLTGGVVAISALVFSIITFRQGDWQTLYISVVLIGSMVAFLRFNFEPAEIFMGDAGSCFLGFFLASLAVSANYLVEARLQHLPVITPLLIFAVPLYDTFSVMAIRILKGYPIWQADNRHFSHRLVSLGLTRRSAVLLIYLITFTTGILAVLLPRVNRADALLLLIHAGAIFAIILLLEYTSAARRSEPDS